MSHAGLYALPATRLGSAPGQLDSALINSVLADSAFAKPALVESEVDNPALHRSAVEASAQKLPFVDACLPLTKRSRTIDLDTRQGFADMHRADISQAFWPEHGPYCADRWQHLVIQ